MPTTRRSFRWVRNWYMLRKRGSSFFGSQWAGGVILVIFAIVALFLANSDLTSDTYHRILDMDFGFSLGQKNFTLTVENWINDAFMALFFFTVGLEIKRELKVGRLSSIKQATLPAAGALGGMIVPAVIYMIFNQGTEFSQGWGIPMATDIAFAMGVLSLLGNKVPVSLKIFLTALAVVDDLGAILVIAIFYTSHVNLIMLGLGLVLVIVMALMNRQGVTVMLPYIVLGIIVWFLFLNSGIHATISGVLVAMTIPTTPRFSRKYFVYKSRYFLEEFRFYDRPDKEVISNENQMVALWKMNYIAHSAVSPAQRFEHILSPFVTFIVMPVFALANAGVAISSFSDLMIFDTTQGLGIFFGLVVGKPVGIFLASLLAIKTGLAVMPKGGAWDTLFGVSCLGGIGFTMSIFIDNLAFAGTPCIDSGIIAVLIGSVTAGIVGATVISIINKQHKKNLKNGRLTKKYAHT